MNYPKRLTCLVTALAVGLLPMSASANVEEVMGKMFSGLSNTTPGGYYETQARGVIAGPAFYYRAPGDVAVTSIEPLTITRPSVSVKCGSIDVHTGALSIMKGKNIEAALRKTAENATSYFFGLAIKAMSDAIWETMSATNQNMFSLGKMALDGCKLGQAAFEGTKGGMSDAMNWLSEGSLVKNGTTADRGEQIDAPANGKGEASAQAADANASGGTAPIRVATNAVWDVLRNQNVAAWFGISDPSKANLFYRQLMTATGTVVARPIESEEGPRTMNVQVITGNTQVLESLLYGGTQPVLVCDNDACLNVTQGDAGQKVVFEGLVNQFISKFTVGNPADQQNHPGIIKKLTARSGTHAPLTAEEKSILSALPGYFRANIDRLKLYPDSADAFVRSASAYIVGELMAQMALHIRTAMTIAANNESQEMQPAVNAMMPLMKVFEDAVRVTEAKSAAVMHNSLALISLPDAIRHTFKFIDQPR